jgi:hypothetical protein
MTDGWCHGDEIRGVDLKIWTMTISWLVGVLPPAQWNAPDQKQLLR